MRKKQDNALPLGIESVTSLKCCLDNNSEWIREVTTSLCLLEHIVCEEKDLQNIDAFVVSEVTKRSFEKCKNLELKKSKAETVEDLLTELFMKERLMISSSITNDNKSLIAFINELSMARYANPVYCMIGLGVHPTTEFLVLAASEDKIIIVDPHFCKTTPSVEGSSGSFIGSGALIKIDAYIGIGKYLEKYGKGADDFSATIFCRFQEEEVQPAPDQKKNDDLLELDLEDDQIQIMVKEASEMFQKNSDGSGDSEEYVEVKKVKTVPVKRKKVTPTTKRKTRSTSKKVKH